MKTRHIFAVALGALMLTACHKEDVELTSYAPSTITATLQEASTRTTINEDREVLWSTGDVLALIYSSSEKVNYTLTDGAGTTSATFTTSATAPSGDIVAALYPSSIFSSYADDKIEVTMPDTYAYTENSIAGAPMAALVNNANNIAFKNAGALLAATVKNIPAGYNKVVLESTDEQLTGDFNISFDGNVPTLAPDASPSTSGKTITISFTASAGANKTFYFPLPVQDYQSLKLSITDDTTPIVLKSAVLNAERNGRYGFTYTYATQAASAAEATTALASGSSVVEVDLTYESTPTPSITIPESNNEQTSLSFTAIPTGTTVEIAATSDVAEVSKEVSIVAPATDSDNNDFNINLPKSTVTLNADADASTPTVYDVVTAKTAANTLIVADNVTINTLNVEGGNVRVSAGGKISSIARTHTNSDAKTYLVVEEGAEVPAELGENIVKKSVEEWEAMQSALNFIEALKAGGEVTLESDVTITEPVVIEKDVDIDLNGKTLTLSYGVGNSAWALTFNGNVTISNGNIVTDARYSITVGDGADRVTGNFTDLNINGNRANQNNGTIFLVGEADVTIGEGVEVESDGYSSIVEASTGSTAPSVVNIDGATFAMNGSTQYGALGAAYGGTINFLSGTVTSNIHAAYAYPTGGTINLMGGEITGTLYEHTAAGKVTEIIVTGGTYSVDPTAFLASGYEATESAGKWSVSKSTAPATE